MANDRLPLRRPRASRTAALRRYFRAPKQEPFFGTASTNRLESRPSTKLHRPEPAPRSSSPATD
jgi:hypothetical protein